MISWMTHFKKPADIKKTVMVYGISGWIFMLTEKNQLCFGFILEMHTFSNFWFIKFIDQFFQQ